MTGNTIYTPTPFLTKASGYNTKEWNTLAQRLFAQIKKGLAKWQSPLL